MLFTVERTLHATSHRNGCVLAPQLFDFLAKEVGVEASAIIHIQESTGRMHECMAFILYTYIYIRIFVYMRCQTALQYTPPQGIRKKKKRFSAAAIAAIHYTDRLAHTIMVCIRLRWRNDNKRDDVHSMK